MKNLEKQVKKTILNVQDLCVAYDDKTVVKNVSFSLDEGEILGIVGESGAGKSTIGKCIIGLLSPKTTQSGSITFKNTNISTLLEKEYSHLRGKEIATVFQDPFTVLNPVKTLKYHLNMILKKNLAKNLHQMTYNEQQQLLHKESCELLTSVGFKNPHTYLHLYPHELSGGMLQRVIIALSIAQNPSLLIVDEPTTALDASLRNHILLLLKKICVQKNISIIIISHDIAAVSRISSRMLVMQLGKCIEQGKTENITKHPKQPYTQKLLSSLPQFLTQSKKHASKKNSLPKNTSVLFGCHNIYWKAPNHTEISQKNNTSNLPQQKQSYILNNISLSLTQGSCFGLIGESGSGKSSVAQVLAGIYPLKDGYVFYGVNHKDNILRYKDFKKPNIRQKIQMIFQNPYSSLNSRHTILYTLTSPLAIHKISNKEAKKKASAVLERVGIPTSFFTRYPKELSGGECQRIAIARSLLLDPEILICDEPTSALDVSTQYKVLQLLQEIQQDLQLTTLFISHDLHVIKYICDKVAVIKDGFIVEQQNTQTLFTDPQHHYSKELIKALQFV